MSMRGAFLLALPLAGILILTLTIVLRNNPPPSRDRERTAMEELFNEKPTAPQRDPDAIIRELKGAEGSNLGSMPRSSEGAKSIRGELLKSGDAAIVPLRRTIFDTTEPVLFRMELISILGDMKGPAAEKLLIEVFAAPAMEETLRTLALSKLSGRQTDDVFRAVSAVYSGEQGFGSRHLLVKAIGESLRPEAAPLLVEAVRKEPAISSRIQAIDSLTGRMTEPGVQETVCRALTEDASENVRLAAIACLGKWPNAAADKLLMETAGNDRLTSAVRKSAANWVEVRGKK
jgi:hypothetical protein